MLNILPNQSFTLNPPDEALDTGWNVSGGLATHGACNSGTIKSFHTNGLQIGHTYRVSYTVIGFLSGTVKVLLGTTSGTVRSANGVYTEDLTCVGDPHISFFSDGSLSVSELSFFDTANESDNAVTVAFFDGEAGSDKKKWTTNYSYEPEMMIRFINSYFTIKAGQLWVHNVNEVRNNFYGQQYESQVKFYDNLDPTTIKLYFSMRTQGNSVWYAPGIGDITITPVLGRSQGMASRLKKNNFKNYQGSFFANFLRNMLDARFDSQTDALFKGEPLRGRYMEITLHNAETNEAILFEVDIKSSASMLTY